jgi:hypothetical protein
MGRGDDGKGDSDSNEEGQAVHHADSEEFMFKAVTDTAGQEAKSTHNIYSIFQRRRSYQRAEAGLRNIEILAWNHAQL